MDFFSSVVRTEVSVQLFDRVVDIPIAIRDEEKNSYKVLVSYLDIAKGKQERIQKRFPEIAKFLCRWILEIESIEDKYDLCGNEKTPSHISFFEMLPQRNIVEVEIQWTLKRRKKIGPIWIASVTNRTETLKEVVNSFYREMKDKEIESSAK